MQKNWSQKDDRFEIAGFFQKSRVFCCYESIHGLYASTHPSYIKQDESIHAFMGRCMLLFDTLHNQTICMSRHITRMCRHMLVIQSRMSRYMPLWVDASCLSTQYIIDCFAWVWHKPLWINASCLSIQYGIDCFAWVWHKPQKSLFVRCFDLVPTKHDSAKTKTNIFFLYFD